MMRTGSIAALAVAFSNAFYQSVGAWLHNMGWFGSAQIDGVRFEVLFGSVMVAQQSILRGIAIAAILLLTAVNAAGARWGGLMQIATTVIKAGTLAVIMVLPFLTGTMETENLSTRFVQTDGIGLLAGFGAAMTAAFWAYDGWGNIGPLAEEIKNPQRNLPLSLFVGIFISIALYLGVTVAYHLVLTMQETADSPFVAASVFERALGDQGAAIASAAVMVSAFGALNSNLLVGPRVIFAMARDRLFLSPMARVHSRYRTPHVAIFAETGWSILLILGSDLLKHISVPGWVWSLPEGIARTVAKSIEGMASKAIFDVLTDYVIFGQLVFYLLAVGAIFVLRVKRPDWHRPYKTFGYPILPAIFVLGSAWFLIGMFLTSPVESIAGLGFLGVGAIVYQFRPREPEESLK
jgi:amino acid transporter